MMKLSTLMAAAAALTGAAIGLAPAAAQQGKLSEIIVYGTDPCPRSTDDNIVVCVRKGERERYRIPEKLREGGTRQQRQAWASKAGEIASYGATGPQSCSAVGPGGHTGCLAQQIRQSYNEKDAAAEADTAP